MVRACALVCASLIPLAASRASSSRLPDGTEVQPWEKPLTFSKTYFVDGKAANADDTGPGSRERPFRTVNKAAQVLQPGERRGDRGGSLPRVGEPGARRLRA